MVRSILLSAVLLVLASSPAFAQSWADGLFEETNYDFGATPRGTILSHPFRVVNNTQQAVTISGVRVSCGVCSSVRVVQNTLQPGQETAVVVNMDSRRFLHHKHITAYVTFSQPQFAEVRLYVQATSREDLLFNPEAVTFGKVKKGQAATASVNITFLGLPSTQVTEVISESNYVQATAKEANRTNTEITFQITGNLRHDTPAGKWFTDLWLKTNNPAMPKLRVPVTVEVETVAAVNTDSNPKPEAPKQEAPKPEAPKQESSKLAPNVNNVQLGQIKAGTEIDRKVILRSQSPFRIVSISGADRVLSVQESSNGDNTMHVLTLTIRPTSTGELSRTLRVVTDMPNAAEIEINAKGEVMP